MRISLWYYAGRDFGYSVLIVVGATLVDKKEWCGVLLLQVLCCTVTRSWHLVLKA